jgi:hypothetical protein
MLQYLGDVAAYISAYRLNTLWEVREAIKEKSLEIGRAVYGWQEIDGSLTYKRVIVVGHSLGSVVAYDLLNSLINEDLANPARSRNVAQRTPLLLTFGSPLDKTAFIFTTRAPRNADVRELLAAAKQPLIDDYAYRPDRWVNLWSPSDWINGSIDFYDPHCSPKSESHKQGKCGPTDPCQRGGRKRVQNEVDPHSVTPLLAHNEFWTTPLFIDTLYAEATRPVSIRSSTAS